jgi:hypothetical protein
VSAFIPLVLEYEAVLTRPEHLRGFGLSGREVESILDAIVLVAEQVSLQFLWRPHLREAAALFGIKAVIPGEIWRKLRSDYEKE